LASSAFDTSASRAAISRVAFSRCACRVKRLRIEPDRLEAVANLRFAQIFKIDTEALPVGKLRVVFSLASEVGIDLDAVADIADEDEGRPAMRRRQRAGIFLRLPLGIDHQDVPGAACSRLAALRCVLFRVFFRSEEIALSGDGLVPALPAALFGFEDKRSLSIEINPPNRVAIIAMMGHHSLEHVIVAFARGACRLGMRQSERIAQLSEKQRIIGAFLPALLALPANDKGLCILRRLGRRRCHPASV
jgi:hypothetical protein